MKILKYIYKNKKQWGVLKNKKVIKISKQNPFNKINLIKSSIIPIEKITLLPPTGPSPKIILTGLNYKDHAKELNMDIPENPIIFLKPATSLIGHQNDIIYPNKIRRLDYEAELALIIKKRGRNIPEKKVSEYILGYTCLNDVTARNIQKKEIQWTRAKSYNTFCPLGPWIETEIDTSNLKIQSYLNGKLKQNSSTSNFIFSIQTLVSFISNIMTLLPGDIISTGTPAGVGKMECNDIIEIKIENIGKLTNQVKKI